MADKKFYDAIKGIYSGKGQWDAADKAGDEAKKQAVASDTQRYYDTLNRLGYGEVAKEFKNSNYDQARSVLNRYLKQGNTAIRPYFYSLGKQYGYSTKDIDNMLKFDNDTGEVSFAGRNIGKPQSIVDGVSYWQESDLDKIFSDTMKNIGASKTPEIQYGTTMDTAADKSNQLWSTMQNDKKDMTSRYDKYLNYNYDYNPYESEIGKSIMADYQWKGNQAASNEAASSGSTNGGNIDSFAAANAARQQLAFENAGKAAVREDFNTRLNNVKEALAGLSSYNQSMYDNSNDNIALDMQRGQQIFDNNETKRLNDAAINSQKMDDLEKEAKITGYVPWELRIKNNHYFNSDGTLKNENIDYMDLYNQYKQVYETTDDPTLKENALQEMYMIADAKDYKTNNYDGKYVQWINDMAKVVRNNSPQKTFEWQNNDADRQNAYDITKLGTDAQIHASDNEKESTQYVADKNLEGVKDTNASNERQNAANNATALDAIGAQAEADVKVDNAMTDNDSRLSSQTHNQNMEATNNEYSQLKELYSDPSVVAYLGGTGNSEKLTISEAMVDDFVEEINMEAMRDNPGFTGKAFERNGVRAYKPTNNEYAINAAKEIANDPTLTTTDKQFILNRLGISEDIVKQAAQG